MLDSGTLAEITGPSGNIILIDPRGMGWTAAPPGRRGRNRRSAAIGGMPSWRSAVDRPLLGQRVARLLEILETLHSQPGGERAAGFHVVGTGPAGPVVLHAALLDRRGLIKKVTLHRSLISWSDVVQNGLSRDQLASVLPGVLESYDLPDLAARLAPRALSILEPVDAMGVPVSQKALDTTYTAVHEGLRPRREARAPGGSRLDAQPLTEADELVVEHSAAQLRMKNGGRVDELCGFLQLVGMKIGEGQGIPRVEPARRAGGVVLEPQPLDVDVERVDFEPVVRVAQVAEQPIARGGLGERPARCQATGGHRGRHRWTASARVSRMASSPRCSGVSFSSSAMSGSTISLLTSPNRRCRRSVSEDAEHWSSRRTTSNRRLGLGGNSPRRNGSVLRARLPRNVPPRRGQPAEAAGPGIDGPSFPGAG